MVLVEVIKKLQLKIEKHLKPYKLKWLNQDSMVMMDEHCLVSFYIDKRYFDGDLCNMMFIDSCHLLLGKP